MSTHNVCFHGEIRKILVHFGWKKKKKNALSGAMELEIIFVPSFVPIAQKSSVLSRGLQIRYFCLPKIFIHILFLHKN